MLTVLLHFSQLTIQKSTSGPEHIETNGNKLNGSNSKDSASFSPRNVTDQKLPPIFSIKKPGVKSTGKVPRKIFTTAYPKVSVTKKTIQNSLYRFGPASHNMRVPPTKFKEIITLSPKGTSPDIVNTKNQSKVTKQWDAHRNSLTITNAPKSPKWRQKDQFGGQILWPGSHQNQWQQTKPVQQIQSTWQNSGQHNQLIVPKNQGVLSPPLAWYNPWKINPTSQQGFQKTPQTNPSFNVVFKQKDQPIYWAYYQPFGQSFPANNPQFQQGFMPNNQIPTTFGNTFQNNWRNTAQRMRPIQAGWTQFSPPLAYWNQQPTQEFPGTWKEMPGPRQSIQRPWENAIVSKPQIQSHPWVNIPIGKTQQSNQHPWKNVKGGKSTNTKVTVMPKVKNEDSLLIKTVNNMTASMTKFIATMEKIITTLNGLAVQ